MSVKAIDYDALTTEVRDPILEQFQAESLISLFATDPIAKGIAASTWAIQYMEATQKASWHAAGYDPNHVIISFKGGEFEIDTIDQAMTLTERDMAFYQQNGYFQKQLTHIGSNLAWTTNRALFDGLDENGNSPHSGQYNYISDLGSGNGTAIRPIMAADVTSAGSWGTFANVQKDITAAIGGLRAKGYKPERTICFYPDVFEPVMLRVVTEQRDTTIKQYIESMVRAAVPISDDFIYTDREGTPTAPAITDSEIYFVDMATVVIGIARAERVRVVGPHDVVRDTEVEAEIWPCPLMIPKPKKEGGTDKFYKGVAVIDGAAQ
jgi:hypothetical protein